MAILTNNFMKKILIWLSGKKTTIATVISALVIFLIGRGLIAQM